MSYKDIEEVRVKRTTKEVIKGKGNRSRKRKSTALEVGKLELELEPEVARIVEALEPWRAPVAQIY